MNALILIADHCHIHHCDSHSVIHHKVQLFMQHKLQLMMQQFASTSMFQSLHTWYEPDLLAVLQAWLVPHVADQSEPITCGLGAAAAVHSGFSASWQSGLKQAVCKILLQAVHGQADKACNMRMLVTGEQALR